jgi:putative colanic acid biosynthesis acetyltransferase WcaF
MQKETALSPDTSPVNTAAASSILPAPATPSVRDPFLAPSTSLRSRAARALWQLVYVLLFRCSPRPFHPWRAALLRLFGARLGPHCHIYPRVRIWAPWNLECADTVAIGDDAIVYNPALVRLGSHTIVSEQAFLCGATHDYDNPSFPMIWAPIVVERYAWICARASIQMGVTIGEGTVLGLGAVATEDLEPWTVYAGIPARRIKRRERNAVLGS